ncbi:MAG: ATP-binding protein [Candidatus Electrothrix sp. AR3]|nr:ATP-binding protein [Candidatus Electrothrix sp. AR3]
MKNREWLLLEVIPETDMLRPGNATLTLRIDNQSRAIAQQIQLHLEPIDSITWVSTDFTLPGLLEGQDAQQLRVDLWIEHPGRYVINGTLTALDLDERSYEWPINFVLHVDEKGKPYQLEKKKHYIVGPRLSSDILFVGRQQLLQDISLLWQEPANKEALLLIGLRRMGKSSLLEKIRRDGINDKIIPIFIDLQGKDSPLAFLQTVAEIMAEQLQCSSPELEQNNSGPAFERFLRSLLPQLAGRYFLLMIDEANFFAQRNYASLPHLLRSLMQAPDVPLLLLFCGTHELRQGARDYDSILYNTTRTKNVSYFNSDESAEVLTRPVHDFLEYDPQALKLAFQLTHGHPLLLQALGDQVIQTFNETLLAGKERSNYVTYGDMEQAGQQLSRKENPAFGNYWEDADTAKQKILVVMASSLDETSRKRGSLEFLLAQAAELRIAMERKEAFKALDQLTQEEQLLYADSGYSFMVALYRRWILWHYPPERFRESL